MPRLHRAQDDARRAVEDLAVRASTPAALARGVTRALAGVVPHDGYRFFGIDGQTLLINRLLASSDNDHAARAEWFSGVYLRSDPLTYAELPFLMRAGLSAVALHDHPDRCWGYPPATMATVGARGHQTAFHDLRSPVGGVLMAAFPTRSGWSGALQLYRRDAARPFRSGEVAFVRSLVPTVGAGLAAAIRRERALTPSPPDQAPPERSGIVILDHAGATRLATPDGERWLDRLRALDRTDGGALPTPLAAAVAGLRAGMAGVAGRVSVATPEGGVQIEASWADTAGGVALVIAPIGPPEAVSIPDHLPLTGRERQVTIALLGGRTNREIAAALHLTEHTVEGHLRQVFAKVGVSSRSRLQAAFFRDVLMPNVEVAGDFSDDLDDGGDQQRMAATAYPNQSEGLGAGGGAGRPGRDP